MEKGEKTKILVVCNYTTKKLFKGSDKYELVFVSVDDALNYFIFEQPDVVLVYAEYEGVEFEEERMTLRDIVASNYWAQIFRLGFLPEKREEGLRYIQLPVSLGDSFFDRILQ